MTYDNPKPLSHYANDYAWRMSVIQRPGGMEPWECVALRLWTKTPAQVAEWCDALAFDARGINPHGEAFYRKAQRIALNIRPA